MTTANLIKYSVFIFTLLSGWAESATNYLSDNSVSTNEASQGVYSVPQEYYIPYQKYIANSNHKYVIPQTEAQIPVAVTSTEKSELSTAYKVDTTKYATAKSPGGRGIALRADDFLRSSADIRNPILTGSQVSYPYLYTLAKVVPSTVPTYTSASDAGNGYYEEPPKKYQYGYRVSNPHTGIEFGHSEVNDGLSTKGYYHVLLPDGRLQNVKYWAGPSGYHATITYETQY